MEESEATEALAALAHPIRLRAFRLLVAAGPEGLWAGEIAECLNQRPNSLSTNLAILSRAGLVGANREGRNIRYRAEMEAMGRLLGFMMRDCCGGRVSECAPALGNLINLCGGGPS